MYSLVRDNLILFSLFSTREVKLCVNVCCEFSSICYLDEYALDAVYSVMLLFCLVALSG